MPQAPKYRAPRGAVGLARLHWQRGSLVICGIDEVFREGTRRVKRHRLPLVVSCLNKIGPVADICKTHNWEHHSFVIGWARDRDSRLRTTLGLIVDNLNADGTVILHCRAGKHRSAVLACIVLMFLFECPVRQAMPHVQTLRRRANFQDAFQRYDLEWILHLEQQATSGVHPFKGVVWGGWFGVSATWNLEQWSRWEHFASLSPPYSLGDPFNVHVLEPVEEEARAKLVEKARRLSTTS